VNLWSEIFLGIIALATLTMAVVQVGVLIAAGRVARRTEQLLDRIHQELTPTFGHVNVLTRDASRMVAIATTQVEHLDQLLADLTQRVEETAGMVRDSLSMPAREGKAFMQALKAALDAIREARRRPRPRRRNEDDDVLFI
jgi:hypothetical protein